LITKSNAPARFENPPRMIVLAQVSPPVARLAATGLESVV
jgi:hypothetical protein